MRDFERIFSSTVDLQQQTTGKGGLILVRAPDISRFRNTAMALDMAKAL